MPLSFPIMMWSPVENQPVYLWNVPNRCFWAFHNIPVCCRLCPNFLETWRWHQIQNKHIFTKIKESLRKGKPFKTLFCYCCELPICQKRSGNHQSVLVMFYTVSILRGESGLYEKWPRTQSNKELRSYSETSFGLNVYGYRHNLWELRKKKGEGVLGPNAAECVTPYIYTVLKWHTPLCFPLYCQTPFWHRPSLIHMQIHYKLHDGEGSDNLSVTELFEWSLWPSVFMEFYTKLHISLLFKGLTEGFCGCHNNKLNNPLCYLL